MEIRNIYSQWECKLLVDFLFIKIQPARVGLQKKSQRDFIFVIRTKEEKKESHRDSIFFNFVSCKKKIENN